MVEVWNALPQRVAGFPRKPRVLEEPCALAVPTPASDELWTVEVRVNPQFLQNRYAIYSDESAYGSFSPALNPGGVFHFECRPQSRPLRVLISRDRTVAGSEAPVLENAIEAIGIKNQKGETLSLFKKTKDFAA